MYKYFSMFVQNFIKIFYTQTQFIRQDAYHIDRFKKTFGNLWWFLCELKWNEKETDITYNIHFPLLDNNRQCLCKIIVVHNNTLIDIVHIRIYRDNESKSNRVVHNTLCSSFMLFFYMSNLFVEKFRENFRFNILPTIL